MEPKENITIENSDVKIEVAETKKENKLSVPGAIVVAGIIIALALALPKMGSYKPSLDLNQQAQSDINIKTEIPSYNIKAVDLPKEAGHILGPIDAPVKIVEYSDLECPYCKKFHETMHQVVDNYNGKVAWEYRHYPLSIHPKAQKEAEGSLCAEEQGGNIAFWNYLDKVFAITPSNNRLDLNILPSIAKEIGLDQKEFEKCLVSGKYTQAVKDQASEWASPEHGTPSGYIIKKDGEKVEIQGAMPYESMIKMLDLIVNEK